MIKGDKIGSGKGAGIPGERHIIKASSRLEFLTLSSGTQQRHHKSLICQGKKLCSFLKDLMGF